MGPQLNRITAFKNVDTQNLELLTPLFESYSCESGTIVIQQGAPANYIYFIIKGKVDISYKPYDGHIITISHIGKGGLFGWSALVGNDKYSSSGTAIEPLSAVRIHGDDLRKFCVAHPEAGRDILENLANTVSTRWHDANKQVRLILEKGLKGK